MNRYAMIDISTGYIWGVFDADSPEMACQLCSLEQNRELHDYEAVNPGLRASYLVYVTPKDFEAQAQDGTDEATISRVIRMPFIGCFGIRED